MSRDIRPHLLPITATLRECLECLSAGMQGVAFVVDEAGVLRGVVTDGDARRAFLAGATLDDPVEPRMTRKFVSGRVGEERSELAQRLDPRVRHLPILDDAGRPVEFLALADRWNLPVMVPSLVGREVEYLMDCLATGWISSQGRYVTRFEDSFRDYHGVDHALCVCNGTAALHLALLALGIGPGDEVIVPDLTFAASANAVLHCGATPVLVDVRRDTWTMDPDDVARKISTRTRALMPVHLYGHPCDMDPLLALARAHGLRVVEDNAEALGAEYRGRKTGTLGDIGCFSFFANKVITTGEGGMVITRDRTLHEKMAVLRDHGMEKGRRYWHVVPGYNYRMTNLQAAIGLAQMERLGAFLARREAIVARYDSHLRHVPGIELPPRAKWARNIHWLYSILVDASRTGIDRDTLAARLAVQGIETRGFFHPLHIQPPYAPLARGDTFPVTTELAANGLSLPTANDILEDDVDQVCKCIADVIGCQQALTSQAAAV